MPPYLNRLDSAAEGFFDSLSVLDGMPNRTRDTAYVFYVKSGQTRVSDILENTVSISMSLIPISITNSSVKRSFALV